MEALRYIKKPVNSKITISLPDSFKDDEVEIIIMRRIEKTGPGKEQFDAGRYRGIWKDSKIDSDRVSREMRDQWERDI